MKKFNLIDLPLKHSDVDTFQLRKKTFSQIAQEISDNFGPLFTKNKDYEVIDYLHFFLNLLQNDRVLSSQFREHEKYVNDVLNGFEQFLDKTTSGRYFKMNSYLKLKYDELNDLNNKLDYKPHSSTYIKDFYIDLINNSKERDTKSGKATIEFKNSDRGSVGMYKIIKVFIDDIPLINFELRCYNNNREIVAFLNAAYNVYISLP